MKITFIRPSMSGVPARDAMEPLAFAILSALTPSHIERDFYDERLEEIPFNQDTDLVAISVETYTARRAYQIASIYRRLKVPVVLGGYHPTLCPDEAQMAADAIVIGDADNVWEELLKDFSKGQLQSVYKSDGKSNQIPIADRSIFAGKKYPPIHLVQYGRGCRYACDFCSIHAFYGRNLYQRPIDQLLYELSELKAKHVFFSDDNLFNDKERCYEMFDGLKGAGVRWSCQASLDITRYPDLLKRMQASGCFSVTIGFESLNKHNLQQMRKDWNRRSGTYSDVIKALHDHGIMVYGTFVFGYDHDDPDSFQRTLEFALSERLFLSNFNPLTPFPGTRLYDRLLKEKRLLHDRWWLSEDYRYGDAAFTPLRMTSEELTQGCYDLRRKFNSWKNILARALNYKANSRSFYNLATHLAVNGISRHEIKQKQSGSLGKAGSEELFKEVCFASDAD